MQLGTNPELSGSSARDCREQHHDDSPALSLSLRTTLVLATRGWGCQRAAALLQDDANVLWPGAQQGLQLLCSVGCTLTRPSHEHS